MAVSTLWRPFLDAQGVVVLDGGLATALEARGLDLSDRLWSARLLADEPAAVRRIHDAYLAAGADCITSASYQATLAGFMGRGLSRERAVELLRLSVELALDARDEFWRDETARCGRLRPLVAASVGPYGAFLANGAEYTGDYGLDEDALYLFHQPRFEILGSTGADLLACETIPSWPEARALARLIEGVDGTGAWLSFSCRDGRHLCDGTALRDAVRELTGCRGLLAIGVNCTAPRHVESLLEEARSVTDLPLVTYPNSGETFDTRRRTWTGMPASDLSSLAPRWYALGARLIGGCCRVGPDDIRRLRGQLIDQRSAPPASA
jgi:homocysteine S-methyltransferase